ncbi:MAG TPA: hypothetical protein VGI92_00915 [Gemmatimonadales bacterium]|jgi:hypothetical protein
MSHKRLSSVIILAAAALTAGACSKDNNTSPPNTQVVSDQQVSSDVVNSAGPAIAVEVAEISTDDSAMAAPPAVDQNSPPNIAFARHRACYQGTALQVACDSLTTDSLVVTDTVTGSIARSFTGPHGSDSMTVAVHAMLHINISGLAGHETFRLHNGDGTLNDTTRFAGTTDSTARSRTMAESDNDSMVAIRMNLPRASNLYPVSGTIVRNVSGSTTVVGGTNPGTRTFSRRVEVDFPADAQGNVTLKISGSGVSGTATCSVNLLSRVVSACTF